MSGLKAQLSPYLFCLKILNIYFTIVLNLNVVHKGGTLLVIDFEEKIYKPQHWLLPMCIKSLPLTTPKKYIRANCFC